MSKSRQLASFHPSPLSHFAGKAQISASAKHNTDARSAFCRISDKPIRSRAPVAEPDALIIQDPTLLHHMPVFDGLPASGYVLINSTRSFGELGLEDLRKRLLPERCFTVPATQLALERVGRPLPNAALLGAFAAITNQVSINFMERAIKEQFRGRIGEANAAAAVAAYDLVLKEGDNSCSSKLRPRAP